MEINLKNVKVGDKFVTRDGKTVTIKSVEKPSSSFYVAYGDNCIFYGHNGQVFDSRENENDIVRPLGLVIDLKTLKIGDKFKRRDGEIVQVNALDLNDPIAPFRAKFWCKPDGTCNMGTRDYDLVERIFDGTLPEVGKHYKTKDGRIATVTGLEYKSDKFTGNFVGAVERYGSEVWDKDGVSTQGSKDTTLIGPYVEPVTKTLFINCDADGCRSTYDTREEADEEAAHDREACIEVAYTVGQGLEGERA